MDQTDDFDAAKAVAASGRNRHSRRQDHYPGKAEFDSIARRLRDRRWDWQGEDSLH
jgi:hypothetical protein